MIAASHGGRPRIFSRAEWLLVFVLAAIQFSHIMDFMIVMPLGPLYTREWGLTPQQFSFVVAAYSFSAACAGLSVAWFIDRFDRKLALMVLFAGFTVSTLLCAVAPGYLT